MRNHQRISINKTYMNEANGSVLTASEYQDTVATNQSVLLQQQSPDKQSMTAKKGVPRRSFTRLPRKSTKLYGVLGLTALEDQEGSSAYLYGKDLQKDKSSILTGVNPHLYSDHEVNKRAFYSSLEDKRKEIEEGERHLERLRRQSGNLTQINLQHQDELMKANHIKLLSKQNKVQTRINSLLGDVLNQHHKLDDLNEMITKNDLFKGDDEVIENHH
jgi:hypothetical protein